jgi:hypothetical protein
MSWARLTHPGELKVGQHMEVQVSISTEKKRVSASQMRCQSLGPHRRTLSVSQRLGKVISLMPYVRSSKSRGRGAHPRFELLIKRARPSMSRSGRTLKPLSG